MKQTKRMLIGATIVAAMVAAAGTASAQTAAETKCHSAISKNITKYQATLAKNLAGCHKGRNAGKILAAVNCNDMLGANSADTKGKAAAARGALAGTISAACTGQTAVLALYPRCPSPAATVDDGGATLGIDDFTELANCLATLSENYMERIGAEAMGAPLAANLPLASDQQACVNAIGKTLSKAVKTVGGTYSKCQAGQEKLLMGLDYDASCLGAAGDTAGKAGASITAITTAINTSCSGALIDQAEWVEINACGQSAAAMNACAVGRVINPTSRGLVAAALELPGTCAAEADVIINAQQGVKISDTRLDSGWSGLAQDVDVIDQSYGAVSLSGCNADCEDCVVTHNPKNGNCRCDSDPTIECDTIAGPDMDDCGGGTCNCMFGPPLALSAGGTPVCVVNRFATEFDGTTAALGEYNVATRTRALVHSGITAVKPCPTCDGDTTANDGNRNGTCDGGSRDGLTCDRNASHPDFGPVSFDCPPDTGANISGAGLNLALEFRSDTVSLTAALPAGPTCASGPCFCGQCSTAAGRGIGCTSNTDCTDAEALDGVVAGTYGTCGSTTAPLPQQNDCDDNVCTSDGNGGGTCQANALETYCDGFTRNGAKDLGVIPCTSDLTCDNADCDQDGIPEAGECGTCTLEQERGCFTSTITATGEPGIFNSEGVSVFCSGQTSSTPVNSSGGLPGPGRVRLDFDFNIYCPDGSTQMQLPGGSNCP